MNAKLTNASEIKSTNQESDLLEISMQELTLDEISSVSGGLGEVIDPPRKT
jgi:hypothetical protein